MIDVCVYRQLLDDGFMESNQTIKKKRNDGTTHSHLELPTMENSAFAEQFWAAKCNQSRATKMQETEHVIKI